MSIFNHPVNLESLVENFNDELFIEKNISVDVLRLDKIHPCISGNKLFKLKPYLQKLNHNIIASFGGPYSNHLHALAYAAGLLNLKSIGIIRGEKPASLSPTLVACQNFGMELIFVDRNTFQNRDAIKKMIPAADWIDFGGYGPEGMNGAKQILQFKNAFQYTHIICAVGSGTTLAGIKAASNDVQQIIGISSMKNNYALKNDVEKLLKDASKNNFTILHDFHFGGFAKYNDELLAFMRNLYLNHNLPTDFVYTGKLFYACFQLIRQNYFPVHSRLLLIHSGGLQGNQSLPDKFYHF